MPVVIPPSSWHALLAIASVMAACTSTAPLPPKAVLLNQDGADALARGDLVVAEARLAVALEYNPRFTEAWVNLGLVEMQRGNFEASRKDLEKARSLNPDLPAPHHALGVLAERRGRGKEAEKDYREALKVDPGFAPARANLARRLMGRGALEEAREEYLRLTEVAPEAVEGWAGLAEALLRLGRERESDGVVARARGRFPHAPILVVFEARAALRSGAFDEAEELLLGVARGEVDAIEPPAPLATVTPPSEGAGRGERDQGGEAESAVRGEAWAWVAVARLARADVEGARAACDEARRLAPASPVAAYVRTRLPRKVE